MGMYKQRPVTPGQKPETLSTSHLYIYVGVGGFSRNLYPRCQQTRRPGSSYYGAASTYGRLSILFGLLCKVQQKPKLIFIALYIN